MHQPPPPGINAPPVGIPRMSVPPPGFTGPPGVPVGPRSGRPPPRKLPLTEKEFYRTKKHLLTQEIDKIGPIAK